MLSWPTFEAAPARGTAVTGACRLAICGMIQAVMSVAYRITQDVTAVTQEPIRRARIQPPCVGEVRRYGGHTWARGRDEPLRTDKARRWRAVTHGKGTSLPAG
jgi:hypothetical protein